MRSLSRLSITRRRARHRKLSPGLARLAPPFVNVQRWARRISITAFPPRSCRRVRAKQCVIELANRLDGFLQPRMEQARRPAVENHVHWNAQMGPRVLISELGINRFFTMTVEHLGHARDERATSCKRQRRSRVRIEPWRGRLRTSAPEFGASPKTPPAEQA